MDVRILEEKDIKSDMLRLRLTWRARIQLELGFDLLVYPALVVCLAV